MTHFVTISVAVNLARLARLASLVRVSMLGLTLSLVLSPMTLHAQLTPTMRMQLFNGTDLEGWTQVGKGKFVVEDRALRTVGGPGLLYYGDRAISNAVVRIVYKTTDKLSNSGVFVRIPERPTDLKKAQLGYEVQIDDSGDDTHATGALNSFTKAQVRFSKPNQWNTMEITLDSNRTLVTINGAIVTDFHEGDAVPPARDNSEPPRGARPLQGYLALQNNGSIDTVFFKEISIRPIERNAAKPKNGTANERTAEANTAAKK
jgi:hypothetical protein